MQSYKLCCSLYVSSRKRERGKEARRALICLFATRLPVDRQGRAVLEEKTAGETGGIQPRLALQP